jgi:hypothetical protein
MLIHLTPKMFAPIMEVQLIDLEIAPFGVTLRGGVELVTRRPYPNKHYKVVCRKEGHAAMDGILLKTKRRVKQFGIVARWAVAAELVVCHFVSYTILDRDFGAVSEKMILWYPTFEGLTDRRPDWCQDVPPVMGEPTMELYKTRDLPETIDAIDDEGIIKRRIQKFSLPTLEPERVLNSEFVSRMPSIESAFRVG